MHKVVLETKIGFGGKVKGEAVVLGKIDDAVDSYRITKDYEGKVLILLSPVSREFLEKVNFIGVVGVVTPSMHYRDFERFRETADFSLLIVNKFGNLELTREQGKELSALSGKIVELDGNAATLASV
jgi:hypothetical protein